MMSPEITKNQSVIKQALLELEQDGRLTSGDLVAAARNPDHPLHDMFEWDDTVAAEKYRIDQAREIIRSVRVVVTVEHRTLNVPVYVRDPQAPQNEQGYASINGMSKDNQRAAILLEIARVRSLLVRTQHLAEAFGLVEQVKEITRKVRELQVAVQGHTNA